MKAPRSHPPLVILMDLLMLLIVVLVISSDKDIYEIRFEHNLLPEAGARIVFNDTSAGRLAAESGTWQPAGGEAYSGAVYVSCTFCAGLAPPGGSEGEFEVALMGPTAQSLRDIVFDQCAARRKCRPLRVLIDRHGGVATK